MENEGQGVGGRDGRVIPRERESKTHPNGHSQEEPKQAWQLNTVWDPGTEERY